jgi:hypothetical protein
MTGSVAGHLAPTFRTAKAIAKLIELVAINFCKS